jgi:hypothetical protein
MMRLAGKLSAGLIFIILTTCSMTLGQTTFGSLVGTVKDPSGGIVPGVEVTLTNLATNGKALATTNGDGIYEFVNLQPGNYRLDAEKSGFKHFSRGPIIVQTQQSYRIDVTMQVGSVTQTVHVTAATPLLQPQTSSLGQVIAGRSVGEMPLNGRNVLNLMELVPSVVPQGSSLGTETGTNPFAWNNYQVNGSFAGQAAEFLDGVPLNNGYLNAVDFIPTQDSIEEFKVQTDNLGPEWGHFTGGVMNLTTKSGTNQIHGEGYEYLRNAALNANTFFNNEAALPVGAFTQNQFGANAGGPLIIPGIYNGKDKTFWFFSWEGFRLREGSTLVDTVPTVAERGGDFSALENSSGNVIPIYNPLSVCGELGNAPCAVGSSGQPIYTRTQFAGNVIPTPMLNTTSLKLENLWPLPTSAGEAFTNVNNFTSTTSVGGNNNEAVARVDQNVSSKQHFFARFSYFNNLNLAVNPLGTGVCNCRCTETFSTKDIVLDDTYSITPTLLTDIHVGFDRYAYTRTPILDNFDLTSIGWPSELNSEIPASLRTPPTTDVVGEADDVFDTQGMGSGIGARDNTGTVSGDLTKILGRHTLKAGVQIIVAQQNYSQTNTASGIFCFCSGYTASSPISGVDGYSFASYLLGYPSGGSNSLPAMVAAQNIYRAVYFGDTWQISSKLTLNLGLRYEQNGPWSERFDRLSLWDLTATNPLAALTGLPLKGEVGLVDSSFQASRNNVNLDELQFAPRLGFAYQLSRNTVVRGGYGLFPISPIVNWSLSPNNDAMSSIGTPFVSTVNGGITPVGTLSNPFPNGVEQPLSHSESLTALNTFFENLGGATDPTPAYNYGYVQQWNLDVQRQLPKGFFVSAAYAASQGWGLGYTQDEDQLPDKDLSLGESLLTSVSNPFYGLIAEGPLSSATITAGQLLRPYPEYTNVTDVGTGYGTSVYNSFQLTVERRFNAGGTLLVAYTNSKFLSDADTNNSWLEGTTGGVNGVQDWNCIKCSYSLSSDDVPQRLVVSYVQNLPFGQGQRYLSGVHGVAGKLISGWGADGITTFQRGFPLKFGTSVNLTNSYGGGSFPDVVPGCVEARSGSAVSRLDDWFNTSCFTQPPAFTFGDESRVDPILRMQGINNWDFAIFKNTNFGPGERMGLQFRTEFFNLFNAPQFGPPGATEGTPQFGVVSSQVNNPRLIQFGLKFLF